jgi:hypothetical protein
MLPVVFIKEMLDMTKTKIFYWILVTLLALACALAASIFWGGFFPLGLFIAAVGSGLFISGMAYAGQRVKGGAWIAAGLSVLILLFIPERLIADLFIIREAQPFDSALVLFLFLPLSFAFVVAALLLQAGLRLYHDREEPGAARDNRGEDQNKADRIRFALYFGLGVILAVKALHRFYWLMLWDSTYDALGYLWLPFPIMAVLFSSLIFFFLAGRFRLAGLLYLLLIPTLIWSASRAQGMDFRQLTEQRAQKVEQAIQAYYTREGHYPSDLRELSPRYMLSVPEPFILYGQDWCYEGGEEYYRLSYVYREHWSDPRLSGRIYSAAGDISHLQRACEAEVTALRQRYPDQPYQYWVEGE